MSEYDNTNRGALFRNTRKEQPNHPDHTGSINIQGREYWLSAWVKDGKNGGRFFSLSAKPKDATGSAPQPSAVKDLDDEIPF